MRYTENISNKTFQAFVSEMFSTIGEATKWFPINAANPFAADSEMARRRKEEADARDASASNSSFHHLPTSMKAKMIKAGSPELSDKEAIAKASIVPGSRRKRGISEDLRNWFNPSHPDGRKVRIAEEETAKNVHLLGTKTIVGFNVNDTLHIQSIKHGNKTSYRWKSSRGEAGNWTSKNHAMKFGTSYAKTNGFKSAIAEEETKPYKGFVKGKNHPEGGLSREEAKRHGIHAGIETKDEAKRKGGFGKLSDKTQSRRKSFCARMQGMKKHNTSAETANDPKSKINASLRVWGCRSEANETQQRENMKYLKARELIEAILNEGDPNSGDGNMKKYGGTRANKLVSPGMGSYGVTNPKTGKPVRTLGKLQKRLAKLSPADLKRYRNQYGIRTGSGRLFPQP